VVAPGSSFCSCGSWAGTICLTGGSSSSGQRQRQHTLDGLRRMQLLPAAHDEEAALRKIVLLDKLMAQLPDYAMALLGLVDKIAVLWAWPPRTWMPSWSSQLARAAAGSTGRGLALLLRLGPPSCCCWANSHCWCPGLQHMHQVHGLSQSNSVWLADGSRQGTWTWQAAVWCNSSSYSRGRANSRCSFSRISNALAHAAAASIV